MGWSASARAAAAEARKKKRNKTPLSSKKGNASGGKASTDRSEKAFRDRIGPTHKRKPGAALRSAASAAGGSVGSTEHTKSGVLVGSLRAYHNKPLADVEEELATARRHFAKNKDDHMIGPVLRGKIKTLEEAVRTHPGKSKTKKSVRADQLVRHHNTIHTVVGQKKGSKGRVNLRVVGPGRNSLADGQDADVADIEPVDTSGLTTGAKRAISLWAKIWNFDDQHHDEADIDKLVGRAMSAQRLDDSDLYAAAQAMFPDDPSAGLEKMASSLDSRNNTLMQRMFNLADDVKAGHLPRSGDKAFSGQRR